MNITERDKEMFLQGVACALKALNAREILDELIEGGLFGVSPLVESKEAVLPARCPYCGQKMAP